jgi:alpha-tubulin suppressor-like RCC1 family protein
MKKLVSCLLAVATALSMQLPTFADTVNLPQAMDLTEYAIKDIAGTLYSNFILLENGTLWVAGQNVSGHMGVPDTYNSTFTQVDVADVDKVWVSDRDMIASGDPNSYTCFIQTKDGTLYATGDNTYGQLGLGNETDYFYTFTEVPITDVADVLYNNKATYILKTDGTLWVAGYNGSGQLGLGDTTSRSTFTKVDLPDGMKSVKSIVSNEGSVYATDTEDTLWVCGYNGSWQLGLLNTSADTTIFQKCIEGIKEVNCGWQVTIFLKQDGTVWSAGYYGTGGLGRKDGYYLAQLETLENIKAITTSYTSSYALADNGDLYSWGNNYYGESGQGSTSCVWTPTKIGYLSDVKGVYSKNEHTFIFLTNDNSLYGVGGYHYSAGSLGLGATVTNYTTITQVPLDFEIDELYVNCRVTFILSEDNVMYVTGSNTSGQLGLGDFDNRYTYTTVKPSTAFIESVVEKAETTSKQKDVSNAYYLANKYLEGDSKESALEKLDNIEVIVDEVTEPIAPTISTVTQTVGNNNATISVGVTGSGNDLEYALNKGTYQDSNEFSITESGEYIIDIKEKSEVDILDEVTVNVDLGRVEDGLNILNKESSMFVGSSLQLKTETIKVAKEIGISLFNSEELVYESSNPKVASVDENGKIKALKQGNTTITVGLGDLEAELSLEVIPLTGVVEGNGDIIINGEIQALVMSLTVPQAVDFVINPNTTEKDETFISPKFYITNNSALDIGVTVEKLTVAEDSSYKFTDVDKDTFTEEEWYRLSPSNSMRYLALRIVPQDKSEWVNSLANECQAIDTNIKLGIIPSYQSSSLKLQANHGTALQPITCKYNTVFVFEIDNLVE